MNGDAIWADTVASGRQKGSKGGEREQQYSWSQALWNVAMYHLNMKMAQGLDQLLRL
jgi:hypothetical protein